MKKLRGVAAHNGVFFKNVRGSSIKTKMAATLAITTV
jgi:hypothetical protein